MDDDVYLKKTITLVNRGKILQFRVSQDLFSSFQIDIGTRFLLKTLMPSGTHSFGKILDLGCGYGPLGLVMKTANETAAVHMVDRDALAVEYSRQNAELNGLSNVQVYGSLGYDDVRENDFDHIISNIPGKAGEQVITHFLKDARYFLKPGGLVAVVVVNAIAPMVEHIFDGVADIDIVFRQSRSGHTVFHYRFTGDYDDKGDSYVKAIDRNVYNRQEATFSHHDLTWRMQTAYGLPEFDSLHYRTGLLLDGLRDIKGKSTRSVAVMNPGQGHVPVFIRHIFLSDKITLLGRDLLSLRYSQRNLVLNDCPEECIESLHRISPSMNEGDRVDLMAGVLREEERPGAVFETVRQASEYLAPDGMLLVSAGSTAIARLIERIKAETHLEAVGRTKRRGYCLLVMRGGG